MNQKKKTVAIFCFSDGIGGMEHDAVKLASRLSEQADVVLACKKNSPIERLYKEGRFSFLCVPILFSSRTFSVSMLYCVRKLLHRYAPENVIFFGASELKTLFFAFLGFNINFLIRHGTTKSNPKSDWFHRLIYSRVNYHIALSKHLLNNVRKIVPFSSTVKYRIIYPSFELAVGDVPIDKSDRIINIVHVGRVVEGKGQIDAVYACRQLSKNSIAFDFNILGGFESASYLSDLRREVSENNLEGCVHLCDHVSNVDDYLRSADIFLFPSAGEGMPNAFIEAMYYGVVCIAYNNTVFPEFLEMGFHLHIVENADMEELAKTLIRVAENLQAEKELASANVALVERFFNQERELSDWDKVLR